MKTTITLAAFALAVVAGILAINTTPAAAVFAWCAAVFTLIPLTLPNKER